MANTKSIADIRKDYSAKKLAKYEVDKNPITQFNTWFSEAIDSEIVDVNVMTLSTVSKEGRPAGRIVLLKGVENNGFVFFTNYASEKGIQLLENPFASLTFYWKELERQVRVDGEVLKISKEESELYFKTRPWKSRVGAWVSRQSAPISNRFELMRKFTLKATQLLGKEVPLPDFWGGYILIPDRLEFWQGRPNRLHDRINYRLIDGVWRTERLSP
jgi:pyridoxamine 5'-phosphate oxidase